MDQPYEDTRTPEEIEAHKIAVAERNAKLKAEREAQEVAKRLRARRRVVDFDATAKALLKAKKVTQAWVDRQNPEQLRRMVKTACIANEFEAISLSGHPIAWQTLILTR